MYSSAQWRPVKFAFNRCKNLDEMTDTLLMTRARPETCDSVEIEKKTSTQLSPTYIKPQNKTHFKSVLLNLERESYVR